MSIWYNSNELKKMIRGRINEFKGATKTSKGIH